MTLSFIAADDIEIDQRVALVRIGLVVSAIATSIPRLCNVARSPAIASIISSAQTDEHPSPGGLLQHVHRNISSPPAPHFSISTIPECRIAHGKSVNLSTCVRLRRRISLPAIILPPMDILLTNDDGIRAPGILAMYRELTGLGEVTVIARKPFRAHGAWNHDCYAVDTSKVKMKTASKAPPSMVGRRTA